MVAAMLLIAGKKLKEACVGGVRGSRAWEACAAHAVPARFTCHCYLVSRVPRPFRDSGREGLGTELCKPSHFGM